jgi:tRNA (guanine-N7-)-methyltransferase
LNFANGRIMDAAVMHSDSDSSGEPAHQDARHGAFFGRRKGKALRPGQARLFEALLPSLCIDLRSSAPSSLADLFPGVMREVRLEIGFGGAEHLIAQAAADPDCGYIGIEPFLNGMAKALAAIDAKGLTNIRLHHGDAIDLLAWLPDASLAMVYLLYPDPWPKRRHWKRRFVQDRTVAEIARVLRPGAEFRFASDIESYCAWTLIRLLRSPAFDWTAERADDWRNPWPGFESTRYEAKAKREGRTPCYLTFMRR